MIKNLLLIGLFASLTSPLLRAQSATDLRSRLAPTTEQLASGREAFVLGAGNSGNRHYISQLREMAKAFPSGSDPGRSVQMALAKLGEKRQLRQIACEVQSSDPQIAYHAITVKLPYVGGWFAIERLASLLPDNEKNRGWLSWGDAVLWPPQVLAMQELPDLVGNSEPAAKFGVWKYENKNDEQLNRVIRSNWLQWIENHKVQLKYIKPNWVPTSKTDDCSHSN